MAILWRVWATSAGVILAVLLVFLALSTFQFSRVHANLVGERLVVIADRTAAPFQAAARIGLPVADVRNAKGLLEKARQTDDRIAAIFVFDGSGKIVHALGDAASDPSLEAAIQQRAAGAHEWHSELPSGFVAGVNFTGPADVPAGGVAVFYPRSGSTTRVWAMAAELSVSALVIFCAGALAAGVLLRLGLRRTIAAFDSVDRDIAAFETDSWRGPGTAEPPTRLRADLDASFARYREAIASITGQNTGSKP